MTQRKTKLLKQVFSKVFLESIFKEVCGVFWGEGGLHRLFSKLCQELWSGSFLSGFLDLVSRSHPWMLCDRPGEALVSSPSVVNVASGEGCVAEPGASGALAVSGAPVLAFGGTPSRALLLPPYPRPHRQPLAEDPNSRA